MSEDSSILGGLWEMGEAAVDAVGHASEAGIEALETAGDFVIGAAEHTAATGAFFVGAEETAAEWETEAQSWREELHDDAGQVWNESMGVVDSVFGTDYFDETAVDDN